MVELCDTGRSSCLHCVLLARSWTNSLAIHRRAISVECARQSELDCHICQLVLQLHCHRLVSVHRESNRQLQFLDFWLSSRHLFHCHFNFHARDKEQIN